MAPSQSGASFQATAPPLAWLQRGGAVGGVTRRGARTCPAPGVAETAGRATVGCGFGTAAADGFASATLRTPGSGAGTKSNAASGARPQPPNVGIDGADGRDFGADNLNGRDFGTDGTDGNDFGNDRPVGAVPAQHPTPPGTEGTEGNDFGTDSRNGNDFGTEGKDFGTDNPKGRDFGTDGSDDRPAGGPTAQHPRPPARVGTDGTDGTDRAKGSDFGIDRSDFGADARTGNGSDLGTDGSDKGSDFGTEKPEPCNWPASFVATDCVRWAAY